MTLDRYLSSIVDGNTHDGMAGLVASLRDQRLSMDLAAWKTHTANQLLAHPIRDVLHSDPFTYRSFSKPRGYAGDAPLLDMIYGKSHPPSEPFANAIYQYTTNAPAPRAVRARRDKLAILIDEAISRNSAARILALAAGHLREIEIATRMNNNFRGEIIALDQDEDSLQVVESEYGHLV